MQNRGWSDPFPVLWFTPREKSEEKNYAGSCIAIYRRSAVPHQGRRLVRGRCFGTGTAVPPAGAAHRRNGGVHRHHPAGGHGVHHVRRVRPWGDRLRQRHRLGHLQLCPDRRHHHRRPSGQGRPQDPAGAGSLLLCRSRHLLRGCLRHGRVHPPAGLCDAGHVRGLHGGKRIADEKSPCRRRSGGRGRKCRGRDVPYQNAGAAGAGRCADRTGRKPAGG